MNKIRYCFVYLAVIFLAHFSYSCRKTTFDISGTPANGAELFDTYWEQMNTQYVYWDIDSTNWDKIYSAYKPKFVNLDITKSSDLTLAAEYLREITTNLIDCHYNIAFTNPLFPSYSIVPAFAKKQKRSDYHVLFNYYRVDTNYLDTGYQLGSSYSASNIPVTVLSGTIDNNILFFSCSSFALYELYNSKSGNQVHEALQFFFNKLSSGADIKGIIIDVRGNQGGDLGDLNFFVGHFIDKPLHFGYTQTKSGNGRLAFTPWLKSYVVPEPDGKKIDIPIVILADMYSASLAEAVVMAFKVFPKCTFIGETTWGATGPIVNTDVYNAGQFKVENFFNVTMASCKFKYIDDRIYEGIGFHPDITVPFDENVIINKKDTQLEKAINILKNLNN